MAQRKAVIAARMPLRRGLGEAEAAIYVGLGTNKFRDLVKDGRMPRPRVMDGVRAWDVDELDAAFRALPREGDHASVGGPNPWHD